MTQKELAVRALDRAVELMNDEGAHWAKGSYRKYNDDNEVAYCSVGAIRKVLPYWSVGGSEDHKAYESAVIALAQTVSDEAIDDEHDAWNDVIEWNDRASTKWEQVKEAFSAAKDLVE